MTTPALRRAWKEWCSFADGLDLSAGTPDCADLHGRLFRLSGSHALHAGELRAVRDAVRAAFQPWLGKGTRGPAGELEQLCQAVTICEQGWRALLGMTRRATDWSDVERVARTAGLACPEGPFWASPLFVEGQRGFDILLALRGRDHAESLALLDALVRLLNHPQGGPLFTWAREVPVVRGPADALRTAALFRDAVAEGALKQEWLEPLGWQLLPGRLLRLCQDISLCFLTRLNEPMPGPTHQPGQVADTSTGQQPGRPAPSYHRALPDPLPVEPAFRKVTGSEAFLRAIAEEPLEDVHRLAFADWLEDKGHAERAQFIRLQCEHDRLPDHPLARRRFTDQIEPLFKAHGAAWTKWVPPGPKPPGPDVGVDWHDVENFRRGMLERVEVRHYRDWEFYAKVFAAVDVRALRTSFLDGLVEQPWLGRLVSLELTDYLSADKLRALCQAPALAGLLHLGLVDRWSSGPCARALAESPRLPALTSLEVPAPSEGDEIVRALVTSPFVENLRKLKLLSGREFPGLPAIRSLASSPALARLEHLDLSYARRGGPAGIEALAASPFLVNLTTLVLKNWIVSNKVLEALATSPYLKKLTCLDLSHTRLRDEAGRILARSANLANLTVLDLTGNRQIGGPGLEALARSPHLAGLRALSLQGVALTPEGARALAESPHWANLEVLDLSEAGLHGASVKALVASPYLRNLAVLDLRKAVSGQPAAVKGAIRKRWPFVTM